MYYIFNRKGECIANSDFEPDETDLSSRQEFAIKSTINFINPYFNGKEIVEQPLQPTKWHKWNGSKWVISPEKQTAYLDERKESLLTTLANRADQLKNGLLVGYPQTEIESFYRQEKEALAWQVNHKVDTPMLTQIARLRGVPFEILVQKVIEKSNQFAVAIGIIIGQRQKFEDRLLVATTIEQLDELEQEINEWQFQVN